MVMCVYLPGAIRHLVALRLVVLAILATASLQGTLSCFAEDSALMLFQASLPALRAVHPDMYDTPEKLQTAWLSFHKTLALAQTAQKKGYADSPEMRTRISQMLAQELILKEAETARPMHSITEREIRDCFDAHQDLYDLPATLGVHEIVMPYDPADSQQREEKMSRAKAVLKALGSQPVELRVFQELAKTNSDPQFFQTNGGSLGVFPSRPHRGQKPPLPDAAVAALLDLKQVGRVTDVLDDGHTLRILHLRACFKNSLGVTP